IDRRLFPKLLWRKTKQKAFSTTITAVDHLSFKVREGEVFGLVGPNASGKTTVIRLLSTVLIPDEGPVLVNGYDVLKEDHMVKRSIGVIFTRPSTISPRLGPKENLLFLAELYGIPRSVALRRIDELLEFADLKDRSHDQVQRFSTGMLRKLVILKGLLLDPPIILLDEPMLGLDSMASETFGKMIKNLCRESGKTVFVATNRFEEAEALCDRVALIDRGRLVEIDTPENLRKVVGSKGVIEVSAEIPFHQVLRGLDAFGEMLEIARLASDGVGSNVRIRLLSSNVDEVLPELMERIFQAGGKLRSLNVRKQTLKEVFTQLLRREMKGAAP
ncbi:MAG: ATP-binding cassette domain-containing protein, partial [Candidatus Bathyarchaeia archaeon]